MSISADQPDVSVIVPARNEEAVLARCLRSLIGQSGQGYEIIVVDDYSADRTPEIAAALPVNTITADPLPEGWTGKCNAVWSGAKIAKGKWLLFTDADTKHTSRSIAAGLQEAESAGAAMLSYSPQQEVHSLAERALMPVVFAELATTYRPSQVSDANSPAAAANGQYLLIQRDAYFAVGGHAAVAQAVLEDVELARLVKAAGFKLKFRSSDVVSTRMYRNFSQMWEGWTKNLALLFPRPRWLAIKRSLEFAIIVLSIAALPVAIIGRDLIGITINALLAIAFTGFFFRRIRQAHFDWVSNLLAVFGLPLFAILLLNSYISHKRGLVGWKGRLYRAREGRVSQPLLPHRLKSVVESESVVMSAVADRQSEHSR